MQIRSYVIVGVGKQWSIRLLSSCLILELEVHRASLPQGKQVGRQDGGTMERARTVCSRNHRS